MAGAAARGDVHDRAPLLRVAERQAAAASSRSSRAACWPSSSGWWRPPRSRSTWRTSAPTTRPTARWAGSSCSWSGCGSPTWRSCSAPRSTPNANAPGSSRRSPRRRARDPARGALRAQSQEARPDCLRAVPLTRLLSAVLERKHHADPERQDRRTAPSAGRPLQAEKLKQELPDKVDTTGAQICCRSSAVPTGGSVDRRR